MTDPLRISFDVACPASHARRSSTARYWYFKVVEPTWQTSTSSSWYMV